MIRRLLLAVPVSVTIATLIAGCAKSPSAVPVGPDNSGSPAGLEVAGNWDQRVGELARFPTSDTASTSLVEEHRIGPDDVLEITVFDAPELSRSGRVSDRGEISLPLLGAVHAAGLTPRELELALEERLRQSYMLEPHVSVQLSEIHGSEIYVMGEVNRPGAFPLAGKQRLTVLQAVTLGQGLRPMAAKNRTLIIRTTTRGDRTEIPVDLGDVLAGRAVDVALRPSDIVFVPRDSAKSFAHGVLGVILRIFTFRAIF